MKSAEILRPLTFARDYATIACRKSNLRRGKYGKKKRCSKVAVQYTFCDGKASVKVRTGWKKMWYNMSAEKNGKTEIIQKQRQILPLRKGQKSFPVVKRSEIHSVLLTVFCKGIGSGRGKSEIWKTKVPHVNLRDRGQRKHAPKKQRKK